MGDPFDVLSPDLVLAILCRCENAALVRAGCVSRKWRAMSREGTVLGIHKNQRVLYLNGCSRWDWDCSLFHMQRPKAADKDLTPGTPAPHDPSLHPADGVNCSSAGSMSNIESDLSESVRKKGTFRHLDLSHVSWVGPLTLSSHKDLEFAALPPTCTDISANGCHLLKRIQVGRTGLRSGYTNPGLRFAASMDLSGCRALENESFEGLFPGEDEIDTLSVLLVHQCKLLADETLARIVRRCPNLKKLGLNGVAGPATLAALAAAQESHLEVLEVAHSPRLSDADVLPLLDTCPHLRRCNLRGCRGVSSSAYNAVAKELYSRLAADGVPVPSDFYYLKR